MMSTSTDTARRWLFVQVDGRPQVAGSLAQLVEAVGPAITEQAMTQLQRFMPSHPEHSGYGHWTTLGWDDYIAVADARGMTVHPDHR